jgi:hypothetical protein
VGEVDADTEERDVFVLITMIRSYGWTKRGVSVLAALQMLGLAPSAYGLQTGAHMDMVMHYGHSPTSPVQGKSVYYEERTLGRVWADIKAPKEVCRLKDSIFRRRRHIQETNKHGDETSASYLHFVMDTLENEQVLLKKLAI